MKYNLQDEKRTSRLIIALAVSVVFLSATLLMPNSLFYSYQLKKFSSAEEVKDFLKAGAKSRSHNILEVMTFGQAMSAESAKSNDYSTTNIQVEGVDEADIIKNDGKYIYAVSGSKIVIIDAYPAESAKIMSETEAGDAREIFISGNRLVVFGSYYDNEPRIMESAKPLYYSYPQKTFIKVYDISDRANPVMKRNITLDGNYYDSRMIGDYVYAVINNPAYYREEMPVPLFSPKQAGFPDIYYFDMPDYSYTYTNIVSLNINSDRFSNKAFLLGSASSMYVSLDNIYITYTKWEEQNEKTAIHRISISNGQIKYEASGEVSGHVLNQFSMDEYNGYFRIATTTGQVSRTGESSSTNNIYVMSGNLSAAGKLEGLAPGESIYSARFMGNRAYLVTFKKIDPLFVIDLTEPANPKVLGKLKIPGYSDYLHPYDENHIIGIGKEAVEAEEGNFAWYQGIKLSLFDVTDVENPKEVSKFNIGDRGTDSEALREHKAFLFSKQKNLLVIPILLAEIDKEKYPEDVPSNMYGDFVWQGAYVFSLDLQNGFALKGRVSHDDNETLMKSGYYYSSPYSVKRTLYMDNVLYTVSGKMIKMNNLDSMGEINRIELPSEGQGGFYYPLG